MSKTKKIPEQDEVLDCNDKNLIVSASAGSGKTTIMIKKIINYLKDKKCTAQELLVLTYTKSAASEMKQKLINKLRDNLKDYPHLNSELEDVQSSDISTFDSFCQKLVKKYFYILNIDPSFGILEGGDKSFLEQKAITEAIQELKIKNINSFETLINNFAPKRNEEEIKKLILNLYSYTTSLLDYQEFKDKCLNFYNFSQKNAENYLNSYYFGILSQIKNNLENLQKTSSNFEYLGYVEYINNLLSIIDAFICEKDFGKKIDNLQNVDYLTLKKDTNDEIEFRQKIINEKTKIKDLFDKIKNNYGNSLIVQNSYDNGEQVVYALFELLEIFISKYSTLKKNLNIYDFDDVERLTILLLQNEEMNKEIKSSYKYIFVDEFQDANAIQEKIIFLLQNNNLFFVGDTKQSIYAFRKSDPSIFLNIEKTFDADPNSEAKRLNCNFRSNKNILDFANIVFNKIMTEKTAGLDYKNKANFDSQADYIDLEDEVCVSLNIINKPAKEKKELPSNIYNLKQEIPESKNDENAYSECVFVAQEILKTLNQNIYDKETETIKKVELSDITILLAKRGSFLNTLTKCLNQYEIPFIVSSSEYIENVYDIMVLYNLIKYSQNTQDDYCLYSIISSPLFNFSDSEIATIKLAYPNEEYFYNAFKNYSQKDNGLSAKINNFKKIVSDFAFDIKYKGIYFSLNKILINSNYLLNISDEEDFQTRKLEIEQYINTFCNSKFDKDVYSYIIYMENAIKQEAISPETNSINAINITTMHSSKGLEYPVVILPNLDDDMFRKPKTSNELKINKDFGIGVKAYNHLDHSYTNGIFYEACKLKNKEIEQSEKIRLLYVAITRAKNKLIMVGYNKKNFKNFNDDYETLSCNSYLGLIMGAMNELHIEKVNKEECFTRNINSNPRMQINCINVDTTTIMQKNVIIPKKSDLDNIEKLSEFLNVDLSKQHKLIALKNSVSSFSFDENTSINLAPKNLTISEHLSEKASELGTLYHKVLETIDFNNVNSINDVKQFIECNFNNNEILSLEKISYQNIFNNINILKSYISPSSKILKEQKFVMNIPYNQIVESDICDQILVQGIVDLMIIKQDKIILIDYKLSSRSSEDIKNHYEKQLKLYEMAISKGFNKPIEKYILNLKQNQVINI